MYSEFLFQQSENPIIRAMPPVILLSLAMVGLAEVFGIHVFEYSKFIRPKKRVLFIVSSRKGMFICYAPSFIAGLASLFIFSFPDSCDDQHENGSRFLLVKLALTIHFFKRVTEVLFVHKYGGVMTLGTSILVSLTYLFITLYMIFIQHLSCGYQHPLFDLKTPGVLLYLLGICGNLYHHFLLSRLRKNGEKKYDIPKGGLFNFVTCPHYLSEIIEFLGVALMSQTLFSFCFNFGSAFYLIGRSYSTRKWYLSKFENFPKDVRAIIPFIL